MSAAFPDHFSDASPRYAAARPRYPEQLFEFIGTVAPSRERAWDCATGNGQAAVGLASVFAHVDASDASAEQVAHAQAHSRVRYSVQPAERTDLPSGAFDAVCVATALHWFDVDAFHGEAKRVLKPGGVIAEWGYDGPHVLKEFDAAFERVVLAPVAALWPPQNRLLWRGYRDLPFPFEPVAAPPFRIELWWSLEQLIDYIATWTAVKRHIAQGNADFLSAAREALVPAWGGDARRLIVMPLHLRCGRYAG